MSGTSPKNQEALRFGATKPAPRQPTPGELLWTLRKGSRTLLCELRSHGEWGVEAQLLENGEFYAGRRFDLKEQAVAYAEETRRWLTGWRKSEILALEWRQVDWAGRVVRLDPGTTKNREGRS